MTEIRDKTGGRPAKSRIDKQNRVVSTKLTELQFYAIRKRATEAGLHLSEYVRQAVVSAEVTPRLNRQDADTIRKLAGEANNINQLAHRANRHGHAICIPALWLQPLSCLPRHCQAYNVYARNQPTDIRLYPCWRWSSG